MAVNLEFKYIDNNSSVTNLINSTRRWISLTRVIQKKKPPRLVGVASLLMYKVSYKSRLTTSLVVAQ